MSNHTDTETINITLPIEIEYTYHPLLKGSFEKGGRQLEPDEPAWFEFKSAKLDGIDLPDEVVGLLQNEYYDEITNGLSPEEG